MLILALSCAAALLAIAALAVALGRAASASPIVYAASLAASLMLLAGALVRLVADPGQVSILTLPIGLRALVVAHHDEPGNARAGYIYLVMASFGTLALLLAFGLLAGPAGAYAFDAMRTAHPEPAVAAIALMLVLIGAGSKAGVVPLHVWLPLAHPAAPSHVSALMSGVMTKVAVYGFVRIV